MLALAANIRDLEEMLASFPESERKH